MVAEFVIARMCICRFLSPADQEKVKTQLGQSSSERTETDADPGKGPKLKGRNKNRSKQNFRETAKVCSYTVRQVVCPYGEKCRYTHDTQSYLATKLPDIGDKCPLFERRGYCPYGVTCRFGSSHLNADGTNIKPDGVEADCNASPDVVNGINKETQKALRKRKFEFGDARDGKDKQWRSKEKTGDDHVLDGLLTLETINGDGNINNATGVFF